MRPASPSALLLHERIVQEVERLERHRRPGADVGRGVGVGAVEDRQERVLHQALGHQVDAAVVRRIDRLERVVLGPVPVLDRRERVAAGPAGVEPAGDGQHGVADRLGVEPRRGNRQSQRSSGSSAASASSWSLESW